MFAVLLLFAASSVLANDINLQRIMRLHESRGVQPNDLDNQLWFTQKLDHFFPNNQTFQQRYYVNEQYWSGDKNGVVLIYVGGEGALTSSSVTKGFIVDLAREFKALVVGLEHRFYGLSHPFQELTTENLRYLSSQLGLADLAYFQHSIREKYGLNGDSWISVGGSYPGALSSWYRLKYPHLISAALASSAPVHAKAEFFEYDQVCRAAAGPQCAEALRNATTRVEIALLGSPPERAAVKEMFGAGDIEDDTEFLYVIADMAAFAIQYKDNIGDKLCGPVVAAADPLEAYGEYAKWLLSEYLQADAITFNIAAFTNTSWDESTNMRQWMFQSCREFGYFQTAPAQESLRSSQITLQWHYEVCEKLYGVPLIPDVDWTNTYYGSNHTSSSNIYFSNGSKDPWHVLGVQSNLSPTEIAEVIDGTSHCSDLHAHSLSDPASLTAARDHIMAALRKWVP